MSAESPSSDALTVRANKLDLLERLADDLAHEIKNPLHSMVINLEVLKRRLARQDADDHGDLQRYIGVLGTELERVNRRIDLLLRLARPARRAEPSTVDEMVQELHELLQLEGRKHEVAVRFEPAAQTARVHVAREPVRQVVLDLALEMIDRLTPGGTLSIRTLHPDGEARVLVSGVDRDGAAVHPPPEDLPPDGFGVERLEVARLVAERIGGRVELVSSPPGEPPGLHLAFSLPVERR